jgi:lipoate-protein ligase A
VQLIDHTYADPVENLACDEALLLRAEDEGGEELLRFWESPRYFVVLGFSRPAALDVHLEECRRDEIPVLRRFSGGGTVLQGPGCVNYALLLRIAPDTPLATITGTSRHILERNLRALPPLPSGVPGMRGESDLAVGGKKFSGNAQRRMVRWVLYHGTILVDFDIGRMGRYLPLPSKQPAYRNSRTHQEFLMNTRVDRGELKRRLSIEWAAREGGELPDREMVRKLAAERYATQEWTYRR